MSIRDHLEVDERFDLIDHYFVDHTTWLFSYERGYREPRFQVPAVVHTIGYEFNYAEGLDGYVYIHDDLLMWTIWMDGPFIEERIINCHCGKQQFIERRGSLPFIEYEDLVM